MVALVLSEEQQMLRELASRFLREQDGVSTLRALRDSDDPLGYPESLWSEMAELGWSAILVPESYNGLAFGHVGMGQIMEQLGRTLTASPLFATAVVGVSAIDLTGTAEQKRRLLPAVAAGELTLAVATDTAARGQSCIPEFRASPDSDGFVLEGSIHNVLDGHCADKIVTVARSRQADATGLFVFDRTNSGAQLQRVRQVDSRNAASLHLSEMRVPSSALLGEHPAQAAQLERLHDIANAHLAAELLGIASESFEQTVQFLKERKQFGVTISSFQALQHRAAEVWTELELLKSAVLNALQLLDDEESSPAAACSAAKSLACRVAERATNEAIQMHGGVGMTDEYDVGLFLKRARSVQALYGDHRYHADRYARMAGY